MTALVIIAWFATGLIGCRLMWAHDRLLGRGDAGWRPIDHAVSLVVSMILGPFAVAMAAAAVLVFAFTGRYFR